MGRRRSKWRRTSQLVKKMMQDARKTRALQSLRQCPVCGNPYSLSIIIRVNKETDKKSAEVYCTSCGFRYDFPEIPIIGDEFWVYSKVLDMVQKVPQKMKTPEVAGVEQPPLPTSVEQIGEAEGLEEVEAEIVEEVEESSDEEGEDSEKEV
jgi:transcription elongation factor Elf1